MYPANKEMGSTDESYSHTGYGPKDYYLMETCVKSLTESLTQQQFPEQRFFEVERTGRLVVERGQELNTEHAQIRTLLDRQSKSSPNVRRRLRITNSRLNMTE